MPYTIGQVISELEKRPRTWLVTGVAGFIGSHLLEKLLKLNQKVRGLDDFSTGFLENIDDVKTKVSHAQWNNFEIFKGDIRDLSKCQEVCKDVDIILHHAALGSVPRSLADPLTTHSVNVDGFFNLLLAAKEANVNNFIFASSSSVYGDNSDLPKKEDQLGNPLSPYAASKRINELYAKVFCTAYDMNITGLRYFNVFGARQDPSGAYAAVIPRWINALKLGQDCQIFGDGSASRDFCYVDNVVEANLLAAFRIQKDSGNFLIANIGSGEATNLKVLYSQIRKAVSKYRSDVMGVDVKFAEPRKGDVPHSLADVTTAGNEIGYRPLINSETGIGLTVDWFFK